MRAFRSALFASCGVLLLTGSGCLDGSSGSGTGVQEGGGAGSQGGVPTQDETGLPKGGMAGDGEQAAASAAEVVNAFIDRGAMATTALCECDDLCDQSLNAGLGESFACAQPLLIQYYDAAVGCMLDILTRQAQCLLEAGCGADRLAECGGLLDVERAGCGAYDPALVAGLEACGADGLISPDSDDAQGPSPMSGTTPQEDGGDGGAAGEGGGDFGLPGGEVGAGALPDCSADSSLTEMCATRCDARGQRLSCSDSPVDHDPDVCFSACITGVDTSDPFSTCAERVACLGCLLPHELCETSVACDGNTGTTCTFDPCDGPCTTAP